MYAPVVSEPVIHAAEFSPAPDGGSVAFDNRQGIAGCRRVALTGGDRGPGR